MKPEFVKSEFVKGAVKPDQFPPDDIPMVIVAGRSNCGKSSLLNEVCRRKNLARVSKTPGRTAEINFFLIDDCFYLVDLPGYGYAARARDTQARWDQTIPHLFGDPRVALGLLLIDSRRGPQAEEEAVVDLAIRTALPLRIVLTKIDKLRSNERRSIIKNWDFADPEPLSTSVLKRSGIEELRTEIYAYVERFRSQTGKEEQWEE